MPLSHDALAESLAGHLRTDHRMTWCDIQLGPSGSIRPDVYAINKSFMSPNPTAYECKVSRADFLSDVTSGKWHGYLKFASAVYFACEGDLVKKADIPAQAGLIVLSASGSWRTAKRATLNPVVIPQVALLKLIIDGVEREGPRRYRERGFSESVQLDRIRKKFGDLVALAIQDRQQVDYEIKSAKHTAERIISDAQERADRIRKDATRSLEPLREELCAALGLPADTDRYAIHAAVQRIKQDAAESPAIARHRVLTDQVRRALDHYGFKKETTGEVEL